MKWTDGRKQKPARRLIERAVNLCGLMPEVWERRTTLRALWWIAYKRGYRAAAKNHYLYP